MPQRYYPRIQQQEDRMANPASLKFEKLLEPGYIGRVKTRNRMIKSASGVGSGFADLMPKEPMAPGSPLPKELVLALADINAKRGGFLRSHRQRRRGGVILCIPELA